MKARVGLAALVLVLLAALPYGRSLIEARSALSTARSQRERQQYGAALQSYEHAAIWQSPGNIWAEAAGHEMLTLLISPELAPGERAEGLRRLRGALLGSRSFWRPETESRRSELLVQTEAALEQLTGEINGKVLFEGAPYVPNYGYQAAAQVFFWLWILAGIAAIWRGFSADGGIIHRRLWPAAAVLAVCYALWLICLRWA